MIARDRIRALVAQAALAPNVHNVQPARWRIEADGATLFEHLHCRLTAGDPTGHDASISLGAAAEGLRLAAAEAGWEVETLAAEAAKNAQMRPVARFRLVEGAGLDPLSAWVKQRQSWRADFASATDTDRAGALDLATWDAAVIADPATLKQGAQVLDASAWSFVRRDDFRAELLGWMRLKRSHPNWSRDGMNTEAMAMGGVEAFGAGLVLGPLFKALNAVGLARTLTAEGKKLEQATALVLFHRPRGESPFESGRHFYRLWLRIEAAGFAASVLASLADDPAAAEWCARQARLPATQRIVSAFRIGRRTGDGYARARLPLEEVLVD